MVVEGILAPLGYVITAAMDGNEALELMKSREYLPDVILLDVQMPNKTGFEVGLDWTAAILCRPLHLAFS